MKKIKKPFSKKLFFISLSFIYNTIVMSENFQILPNEITCHILSFNGKYSGICSRVCTLWNVLVKDKKISCSCFTNLNLVIWGSENISEFFKYGQRIFDEAAKGGHLEVLKCLRDQNPPGDYSKNDVPANGRVHMRQGVVIWKY